MVHTDKGVRFQAVPVRQISEILEVTDSLGLNREEVEIPLSPGSPGVVRRLPNGTIEITVDAEQLFDHWLPMLPEKIRQVERS